MIVYSLIGITLLAAIYSLHSIWMGTTRGAKCEWHRVAAAVALGSTTYLYGAWVFLSVYLKYVFGACMILLLIAGLLSRRGDRLSRNRAITVTNVFFTIIFGTLSILYFTGTTGRPEKVALAFPLKEGTYFVFQGGKGLPSNLFHYGYRGAVYAMDLVKLNKAGNRADKVFSSDLSDYGIFNDTIYSPCNGIITRVENENPDNIPPSRKRGPTNTNMVVIETDSFHVFMAHLKQGSVLVQPNQQVKKGQPLAQVGNSGFTLEPHLHIQVHKNTHSGLPWYREDPLYIEFDGRTYLLFETIRPHRVDMVEP